MAEMSKEEFIIREMCAVFGQESNRNYSAYNGDSSAGGAYQFMPGTWDEWAKASGYGEWAGVHPSSVPPEVQDAVMYYKFSDLYDQFKARGASDADMALYMPNSHYGGHNLGLYHYDKGFLPDTPEESNGREYPSQLAYSTQVRDRFYALTPEEIQTSGLMHLASDQNMHFASGLSPLAQAGFSAPIAYGAVPFGEDYAGRSYESMNDFQYETVMNTYNTPPAPEPLSYLEGIKHGFEESSFGQWIMRPSGEAGGSSLGGYFPDDNELIAVNNMFPQMDRAAKNEKIARLLGEATSKEHLMQLIEYEKERDERAYRAEKQDYISIGALGTLTGSMLNPINLIPYARGIGAAGKVIRSSLGQKIARAAYVGAQNGALNLADNYGAHRVGGVQFDPVSAFAGGMIAGSGMHVLGELTGSLLRHGYKITDDLQRAVDNADTIETRQAYTAAGYPDPQRVYTPAEQVDLAQRMFAAADAEARDNLGLMNHEAVSPEIGLERETARLQKHQGGVYIAPKEQIDHFANRVGLELPKDMRAMYVPSMDTILVNRDAVKSKEDLTGLLAHEHIIHRGLKLAPKDMYDSLMEAVVKKTEHPEGIWNEALKHARSDDPEEILAHAVELQMSRGKNIPQLPELTRVLRHIFGDKNMSQKQINEAMREIGERKIAEMRGYTLLPDQTAIKDGVRYSIDNPMHPHLYDGELTLPGDRDPEGADAEGFTTGIGRKLSPLFRWAAQNKYIGTDFGKMRFAASKALRKLIDKALLNPYQQGLHKGAGVIAESLRNSVIGHLQKYDAAFINVRSKALGSHIAAGRLLPENVDDAIREFNAQSVLYHDILHGAYNDAAREARLRALPFELTPEIKEAAEILYAKWQSGVDALKRANIAAAKAEGITDEETLKKIAILTEDFAAADESFTRGVDVRNYMKFQNHTSFGSDINEVRAFLKKYALAAMEEKEEANILRFLQDKGLEDTKELRADFPTDEYNAWKDREAHDWALGITDRDISRGSLGENEAVFNTNSGTGELSVIRDKVTGGRAGDLPFLRRRAIMDTSFQMQMKDGTMFSFDKDLRDFDVDHIMNSQTNLTAGAVAWRHLFKNDEEFIKTAGQVYKEIQRLTQGIRDNNGNWHKISQDKADDIYQTFLRSMSALRGRPLTESLVREQQEGTFAHILGMLQNATYTAVGGNLGFNQMAELIGAVGEAGVRLLPKYASYILKGQEAEVDAQAAHEFARAIGYHELAQLPQQRLLTPREFLNEHGHTVYGRGILAVDRALNATGRLASQLNGMPYLTRTMTDFVRGSTLRDLQHLANGRDTQIFHNLLDPLYLKEAGVTPEKLSAIYRDINRYLPEDIDPTKARQIWRQWQEENPATFFAVQKIMEDTSARALTKASIGTVNSWYKNGAMRRLMGFFLNFTFMASHAQFLRMMNHPARAFAAVAIFSALSGLAGYGAVSAMNAAVKYPLDPQKRKEYLERRFSARPMILAALTRGAFLSPLAYATNIGGILGIEGTDIRTTTGNAAIRSQGMYQQAAGQFPVLNYINSAVNAADSLYEQGKYTLSAGRYGHTMSSYDLHRAQGAVPFGNWMGTQLMLNLLEHTLQIPEKRIEGTEVVKQRKEEQRRTKQSKQHKPKERN
jgi:internal virion protein